MILKITSTSLWYLSTMTPVLRNVALRSLLIKSRTS
jgi:hypothetical protein